MVAKRDENADAPLVASSPSGAMMDGITADANLMSIESGLGVHTSLRIDLHLQTEMACIFLL